MTAEAWRLHSSAWQLIYMLQKTTDSFGGGGGGSSGLSWDGRAQSAGSSRTRRFSDSGNDSAVSSPRGHLNLGSSQSLADAGESMSFFSTFSRYLTCKWSTVALFSPSKALDIIHPAVVHGCGSCNHA